MFERLYAEAARSRRRQALWLGATFGAALVASVAAGEVSLGRLAAGLPSLLDYIHGTLPTLRPASLLSDLGEWYWALGTWLKLLADTIVIAFLATLMGGLAAFVLCFPATRNLGPSASLRFACRRSLEIVRTVPEIVYALIFVVAFGLGPLPGVLAIAMHSAGALGKLFSEVVENVDPRPIEGVRAAGGGWLAIIRYAVVPQVLPSFLSYALLRFEINVRAASVVGFVGAGGIGQELYFVIRQFVYLDISAIVLLLIVTVVLIDLASERARHALIGREALR